MVALCFAVFLILVKRDAQSEPVHCEVPTSAALGCGGEPEGLDR
jgi:hypothetical protein